MYRKLLKLDWDAEGVFRERPNRFVGMVELPPEHGGGIEAVHVHDPGRLRELLFPGARVALKHADRPGRKTAWTLVAAQHQGEWVLVNSGLHRAISHALLSSPGLSPIGEASHIVPEVMFGKSRLDYRIERADGTLVYVEVKGCTLAVDGVALFPDAPTKRGARHVAELMELKALGHRAAIIILVFRKNVRCFRPNRATDPEFAAVFQKAVAAGVEVYPVVCAVQDRAVWYQGETGLCID